MVKRYRPLRTLARGPVAQLVVIDQLNAHRGKGIDPTTADRFIGYALDLINAKGMTQPVVLRHSAA